MPSARLSFSMPLFKKQAKRFWPLWGMYTFILLMMLPVYSLLQGQYAFDKMERLASFHHLGLSMAAQVAPWFSFFFGLLVAMAIWSYLHNHRAASMIHALPLTRESLFLTNYLTGLAFFVIPNLLIFLLSLGTQALGGVVATESLLIWLLCQTLLCFFFYSFATLLAFVTGHILILPALFVIFNVLAKAVTWLLQWSFREFVYGFAYDSIALLGWIGKWLSPMYAVTNDLQLSYVENSPEILGISTIWIYAVAGLALVALAYLLYRHRRLEMAGEIIAVGFLRPVFKYGVAVCAGLIFGNIFYQLFSGLLPRGVVTLLLLLLLWGAIGYFASEMLLRKSFRLEPRCLRGFVALALVFIVFALAMEWDMTGYERTVPAADQVELVRNVGKRLMTDDPEYQAAVIALHEALVREKDEIERMLEGEDPEFQALAMENDHSYGVYTEGCAWKYVSVEYALKNGRTLTREYQIPVTAALLARKDSSAALYNAIMNRQDWVTKGQFPAALRAEDLVQIEVTMINMPESAEGTGTGRGDFDKWKHDYITLTGEEAQLLYAAVLEDLRAGRLGQLWLLRTEESLKTDFQNDIYFTFRGYYNTGELDGAGWHEPDIKPGQRVNYEISLTLQATASSTLAAMEQLGIMDQGSLMTKYDWQRAEYDYYEYDRDNEMVEDSAAPHHKYG